jgi:hypothetical protein
MDFSWGWVKPNWVVTIELLAKGKLELAQKVMPQATHPPIVANQLEPERREQRLRLRLLVACPLWPRQRLA